MGDNVQMVLTTKQIQYAIDTDCEFSLSPSSTRVKLNSLVKGLLKGKGIVAENVEFDFLISGEILRGTLQEYLDSKDISSETILDVEYFVKYPAPSLENSLKHDAWVGAVKRAGNWILSGCHNDTLHLWSATGEHKLQFRSHPKSVYADPVDAVCWVEVGAPVSSFLSAHLQPGVMLWQWNQDTNSVKCVRVFGKQFGRIRCIDVHPTQRKFITGSYNNPVRIWSLDTPEENSDRIDGAVDRKRHKRQKTDTGIKIKTPLRVLNGHTSNVYDIQWADDNEAYSCSQDCTIKLWDTELGAVKTQINGKKAFFGLSYSPLSRTLVASSELGKVYLYDPRLKEGTNKKSSFTAHRNCFITRVKWSPSNEFHFISGSYDKLVKLWDTRNLKAPLYVMTGHEDKVLAIDWSLENTVISGGADCQVKIFQVQDRLEASSPME